MKEIFKKIALWLIISILVCTAIYLLSTVVFASFDVRDWHGAGRFLTGFAMVIAICVIAEEVSYLDLEK